MDDETEAQKLAVSHDAGVFLQSLQRGGVGEQAGLLVLLAS